MLIHLSVDRLSLNRLDLRNFFSPVNNTFIHASISETKSTKRSPSIDSICVSPTSRSFPKEVNPKSTNNSISILHSNIFLHWKIIAKQLEWIQNFSLSIRPNPNPLVVVPPKEAQPVTLTVMTTIDSDVTGTLV